jgi:hypothetical protein
MVQLPSRHKLPALDDETQLVPPGASLWEMALQGQGRSVPDEFAASSEPGNKRFRRVLLIVGGAGLLVLVGAVGLLGLGRSTDATVGASDSAPGFSAGAAVSPNGTRHGSPCLAQPLIATPAVGASEEIVVGHVPHGVPVNVVVAYPGGTAQYSAAPTSNGYANVPVTVASAPPSQPVVVTVTVGTSSCQTTFTPAASTSG